MKKKVYLIITLFCFIHIQMMHSQELNMKITVNSDRIEGTDKSTFSNLQESLTQLVNGRKWTNDTFLANEKIDCSILITINSKSDDSYTAEIQVISSRPVFNSSYVSPMFNFKDTELEFEYIMGQNIDFTDNNVNNNLAATIAYYTYIILGLDFDSFNLGGGKPYFERAMSIANSAQTLSSKGWTPFGGDRNRYALALSLTGESTSTPFHNMWYNYHRKGLDEMANNATRGRTEIEKTVPDLQKIYTSQQYSPILLFYGDTKLEELLSIYTKSSSEEKQTAHKILQSIYPTKKYIIDKIKN